MLPASKAADLQQSFRSGGQTENEMQPLLRRIAPRIRAMGFRGSGQTYRRTEGDFVFVINFQGSQTGDKFYVNLGAQPTFIPAEGDADLAKLKEYDCMLRCRVGTHWPWEMSEQELSSLESEIDSAQAAFFGNAQTLRAALATDSSADLLRKFGSGTTKAHATLQLARAAAALGHFDRARELVALGLELAGESATLLRIQLQNVCP